MSILVLTLIIYVYIYHVNVENVEIWKFIRLNVEDSVWLNPYSWKCGTWIYLFRLFWDIGFAIPAGGLKMNRPQIL